MFRTGDVRAEGTPLGLAVAAVFDPTVSDNESDEASSPCASVTSTPSNRFSSASSSKSAENDSLKCSVRVLSIWFGRIGVLWGSRLTTA